MVLKEQKEGVVVHRNKAGNLEKTGISVDEKSQRMQKNIQERMGAQDRALVVKILE